MGLLVVVMVPLFDMQAMKELLESFPPLILAMVGVGGDLEVFATNEGFVAVGFFGKSALIFAAYPVVMGMRITSDEEDKGIMDMLLSLPLQRAQMVIEKFAAYAVSIVGVVALIYLGMELGVAVSGIELDMGRLTEVTFYLIPVMIFHHGGYDGDCGDRSAAASRAGNCHGVHNCQLYVADDRSRGRRHRCRVSRLGFLLHILQCR